MKYLQTFEKFTKVAFHGYKMDASDMQLKDCEIGWSPGGTAGCPEFSDDLKISKEDEELARQYLEQPIETLIAYSRGAAILLQSLLKGADLPKRVILVAPAWKRCWSTIQLTGSEIKGATGHIIHGAADDKVPVKHSVLLSLTSGLPLYISTQSNHVDILKYKETTTGLSKIQDRSLLGRLLKALPDWGTGDSTPEQVLSQHTIIKSILLSK